MRAFVMKSIGETGFADKDAPEAGPADAIVRPMKGLVCTSDVHTVHGAIGEREDLTLGHETVGVIETVGKAVEDSKPVTESQSGLLHPTGDRSPHKTGIRPNRIRLSAAGSSPT